MFENQWLQMFWRSLYRFVHGPEGMDPFTSDGAARRDIAGGDVSEALVPEPVAPIPYQEFLAQAAQSPEPSRVFLHHTDEAAADTIAQLLKDADQHMYILSMELCDPVYGRRDVCDAAVDFVKRGGELALLTRKRATKSALLDALFDAGVGEEVRVAVLKQGAPHPYVRLAVNDRNSFRFEPGGGVSEASVQFHAPEFAATMHSTFVELWVDHAEELELADS